MVGVGMCEQNVANTAWFEPVLDHPIHDLLDATSSAGIDQRVLVPAIDQVDVAVKGVSQVEPHATTADDMYSLGDSHCMFPSGVGKRSAISS